MTIEEGQIACCLECRGLQLALFWGATASLFGPTRAGDRHTMPARNPSVGIPSKATGLPGIMFATLGVSPAGRLGPNPYHPSPKLNIAPDQISAPLLWNTWSVAS